MTAYSDRPSPVHRLDPRVKIAWSVVVSLLAIVLRQPWSLGLLLALAVVPWFLARPPLARLRLLFVAAATMVVGSMISQGFFYTRLPRTELLTLLPGLSLCKEGVVYGAVASLRLLAIVAAGALVVVTTHPSDLILALGKWRVPNAFAFMLALALRFLPDMVDQTKRILAAQQLRGAGGRGPIAALRRFRLLLVPLLATSLRSARRVALAAEVRAYSADRVPAKELRFARADWLVTAGLALVSVVGVVAAFLQDGGWPGGLQ